ncbi:MAG: hypothetical protein JRH13_03125 [Deltaproteobacteria bacterium]|nr:hypothetical protein [Deltaproteobacteria bacterium]MBW2016042.1 hypothetical protein [Deltaproteobacteria bacterium]MBW2128339.1 hypothetical protein [Deltaproteobacteria bacterium]
MKKNPKEASSTGAIVIEVDRDSNLAIPVECEVIIDYSRRFLEENGIFRWMKEFKLGTAGYRDAVNMNNFFATDAPFNAHTVLLISEAMARIHERRGHKSFHIGGEVRRYTKEIIQLLSRVFAHHGIMVHLHADRETTPIWASSFGVFYNELDGAANITASHSQCFKQGIKPMDERGMQLLDMADEIREEMVRMGEEAEKAGLRLHLASLGSSLIRKDFQYIDAYSDYLRGIIPEEALELILEAQKKGMKVGVSTVGGSMHENSLPIFQRFGITTGPGGMIQYMHKEKRDDFHGVGLIGGEDHGCDPTKAVIYRNIGLKERMLSGEIHFGFIWDPDGDRYNIVTLAEASMAPRAEEIGLEVEQVEGSGKCVVYFRPNQLYFLIAAQRLEMMARSGELFEYDFIIGTTYPTTRSISELADFFNRKYKERFEKRGTRLRVFHTPVGFKYFGRMVEEIEAWAEKGGEVVLEDIRGERVSMGRLPRILIMAEESGGASMGGAAWNVSKSGKRRSLALKEKDGMQISLLNLGVMAKLFLEGKSYAALYVEAIEKYGIRYRYSERIDRKLFDESLMGRERERARRIGNRAKDYMVEAFRSLTRGISREEARERLQEMVKDRVKIPEIHSIFWAGDGTYIDFGDFWFELRASGTDAVLRFYIEGLEKEILSGINQAFVDVADEKIREFSEG